MQETCASDMSLFITLRYYQLVINRDSYLTNFTDAQVNLNTNDKRSEGIVFKTV